MSKQDEANACFMGGFTCSAAVFSTFAPDLGLDAMTAKKIACGLGAGISKTGNICGAVSGAILVLGLKYGKGTPNDNAATDKTRALVREFICEFTAQHGSINCTELLGYNLNVPEEYERARNSTLFVTRCPVFVRDAVAILEKMV